jgi:hypothetical protein
MEVAGDEPTAPVPVIPPTAEWPAELIDMVTGAFEAGFKAGARGFVR